MALEIQETVSIDDADVWDELKELIPSLLEDGIRVFYNPESVLSQEVSCVFLEKNGNIAGLEYHDFALIGYYVSFPIKPSREAGSGIGMINYDDQDKDHTTLDIQEALKACAKALQPEMKHWLNGKTYPNYGYESIPVPVVEITEI